MADKGAYTLRTDSQVAAHAGLRLISAIEDLERMNAAKHAELNIKLEGRKVTVWVLNICLGATTLPTSAAADGAAVAVSAGTGVE